MDSNNNSEQGGESTEEEKNFLNDYANSTPLPNDNEPIGLPNIQKVIGKIRFYQDNSTKIKFRLINKPNYEFKGVVIHEHDSTRGDFMIIIGLEDNLKMAFAASEIDSETIMPINVDPVVEFYRPILPVALRLAIFSRDKNVCQYNFEGCTLDKQLEIDHIVPVSLGGLSIESNLITSCSNCNKKKGNRMVL